MSGTPGEGPFSATAASRRLPLNGARAVQPSDDDVRALMAEEAAAQQVPRLFPTHPGIARA